jgi:hypothetical protein
LAWENSEVSPVFLFVAVAVMYSPSETAGWVGTKPNLPVSDFTSPCLLVVTCICPRKVLPSSRSAGGLEKNWMMKVLYFFPVLGVLSSSPLIRAVLPTNGSLITCTEVMTE